MIRRSLIESFYLYVAKKVWWTSKRVLSKATPTTPNKRQTVFVRIHQKIGFLNARPHLHKKYKIIADTKAENGKHVIR